MNIKCALGIELKSIFASRNLNAKYTVMICYAQSVLARCIINAESLFSFSLSLSLSPELLLFRSSIFQTVTIRALSISVNREHPCASHNPIGKLIRSDNLEEFDVGASSPCACPLSTGVNPSHIRERLPLIIFSWWTISLRLSYIKAQTHICARPLGVSPGFSHRNTTHVPRAL